MANEIRVKRSAVPGKVPLTTDLDLGELALNTFDGKLYTKKNDGTESIVHLNDHNKLVGLNGGTEGEYFHLTDPQHTSLMTILGGTINASQLNGQSGSYYLNYNNFSNTPTIGNATITISAGDGLGTGGSFTTNQVGNSTITINNTDRGSAQNIFKNVAVSGQTSLAASTNTDTLTLVAGSNVSLTTNAGAKSVTINSSYVNTTYSAGSGISLSGTTFSVAGGNGLIQDASGLSLGTPSALTEATSNAVTTTTHTHSVNLDNRHLRYVDLTCETAIGTAAKTTVETVTFEDGVIYNVLFTAGTSVSSPTLNGVNIRLGTTNTDTTTLSTAASPVVVPMRYHAATDKLQLLGSHRTSDNNESYTVRWNSTQQVGEEVTQYKFCMKGLDGKFYPLSIGNTTANTKTPSNVQFLLNSPILAYHTTSTLAANGTNASSWHEGIGSTTIHWTLNQSTGFEAYKPVYLKGTVNSNGTFTLDNTTLTSWFTQNLPSTEDGFIYIRFVDMVNTTTSFRLPVTHPIYEYKNGGVRQYTPSQTAIEVGAAPESHTHGNITNTGAIGVTANLPLITTTSGVVTTGTFGSAANTFCQGNDSRLSDARTPTAHTLNSHTSSTLAQLNAIVSDATLVSSTGTNASGSWGISITGSSASTTGNAGTATTLATARTLTIGSTGKTFNGSANVSWSLAEIGAYAATNPSGFTSNTGTVTSVAAAAGTGISVTGSPITTSGTLTITNTAPNVTTNITTTHNASTVVVNSSDGTNGTINAATQSLAGVLTSADKTKLDGIATGATANTGTVTSVAVSGGAGISVSGSPITGSGTITVTNSAPHVATDLGITTGTTAGPIVTSSTGTNATLPTATASASGVVTTAAQTWAGAKTFNSTVQTTSFGVGTAPSGTTGEIRATNNITAYYSDKRLKNFSGKIENALDKVSQLNGYYFTENEKAEEFGYNNKKQQVGLSAQEVEMVLPEIVMAAPFDIGLDENGNEISKSGDNYKTIYYDKLVPLLVEAIKEQQTIIEDQNERLNRLEQIIENQLLNQR